MKFKICYCFLIIIFISVNAFTQTQKISPKQIIFNVTENLKTEEVELMLPMLDSSFDKMNQSADDPLDDSLSKIGKEIFNMFFVESLKNKDQVTIILETNYDTIWRYRTVNTKIIGDYERIDKNGMIYTHARIDRNIISNSYSAFKDSMTNNVLVYENDVKEILGFKCFKVIIKKDELATDSDIFKMGTTFLEMYVTNQINLPAHAIVSINDTYEYFPLEVNTYTERFPNLITKYMAVSIQK